jgi:uncharacterized protein
MISQELLDILICPECRTPLTVAEPALVERVNAAIRAGGLKNRCGEAVAQPIDGGLLRQDGAWMYPIVDGIPVLLLDESIPLEQLR